MKPALKDSGDLTRYTLYSFKENVIMLNETMSSMFAGIHNSK